MSEKFKVIGHRSRRRPFPRPIHAREKKASSKRPSHRRPLEDKETSHLVTPLLDAEERLAAFAPDTRAIFVMDRGFDCWPVLALSTGCS